MNEPHPHTQRRRRGSTHANMAALVMLLTRKPRTRSELAKLLGCRYTTVVQMLAALAEEGLVDVTQQAGESTRHQLAHLYTWAPQT